MELQMWREILCPYDLAVEELKLKFVHIMNEYRTAGRYSPIEQVDGRVKSISSILDKMQRKKININEIETDLEDIAGIRVICQFVEDIDRVVEIIEQRSDMEIKTKKDYITKAKDSGYRSFHVIIYYDVDTIYGKTNPGGDTDPHTGHEFLGNSGALPSVQIQGKYPRAYHGKAHECGGCHRGP